MEEKDLLLFKERLEGMKNEINSDVEQTLNEMTSQTGNIPDPNDRASVESDRSFELRIRGRERKLMDKIEEALARIEDGSYGICAGCGEDIAVKRLEARPVAKYCIDCKNPSGTTRKRTRSIGDTMPELRKDPILGRWIIIAQERGKRPTDFLIEEYKVKGGFLPALSWKRKDDSGRSPGLWP